MDQDQQLLQEFLLDKSQPAFARLVERHVDMVYSAARRGVPAEHLAEDVTQAVFILLASKAASIGPQVIIAGWLFNVARLAASDVRKRERRRQVHEQEAGMNAKSTGHPSDEIDWERLSPLLNDAVSRLSRHDRDAVVLRFFENRSHAEIGQAMGVSEDAAKMRLSRAIGKLRKMLSSAGLQSTTPALVGVLTAKSMTAAPPALATKALASASGVATHSAATIARGAAQKLFQVKLKIAAMTAIPILTVAASIVIMNRIKPPAPAATSPPATPAIVAATNPPAAISPASRPDLSTPQTAVISFFKASRDGDLATAKAAAIYGPAEEQLLDVSFAADHEHALYIEAARQRFGPDSAKALSFDANAILIAAVQKSVVHENGDAANIGDQNDYPCRKIAGEWKYDLVQLHKSDANPIAKYIQYEQSAADFDRRFATEIAAGKWASFDEMQKAYAAQAPAPPGS